MRWFPLFVLPFVLSGCVASRGYVDDGKMAERLDSIEEDSRSQLDRIGKRIDQVDLATCRNQLRVLEALYDLERRTKMSNGPEETPGTVPTPEPETPADAPAAPSSAPESSADDGAKGKVKIEGGVLRVEVPLTQRYAKILAKGLLIDAMGVVDQYFSVLAFQKAQRDAHNAEVSKRVIDRFINKNGDSRGV